jgi:adenine deaminase
MTRTPRNTKMLIDTAMGHTPADLVIRHGTWVCVQTGEFIPGTDIAIKDGCIAYVGPDASHTIGRKTQVIEAKNKYLVPGLLDGHLHVESGMLTVTEYVRAVIPHGTTGMFIDPHEIANVFGLKGVRLMADEAQKQAIHVYVQVPSCVPSAPGMETSGGEITPADVAEALTWEGVVGLGEMMNYPGVAAGDPKALAEMEATRQAGKVIGGHYAGMDLGLPFHAYAAGGVEDDHEGTRLVDAVARARQGMKPMLRHSSAWQDVAVQVEAITKLGLDSRHFILCTDDCHAETLVGEGHMDRVVRYAIAQGLPPMTALQMSTLNTAEHFGLARDIGQIAPGRWADILLVQDLADFRPELVIGKGKILAREGKLQVSLPEMDYPEWVRNSINLKRPLTAIDFRIPTGDDPSSVKVNVIGVIENQAPTQHLVFEFQPVDGEIEVDVARDVIKLAVVDRHFGTGSVQVGLVTGFGFTERGAVASTVAHDCHQMLVMGTDEQDMSLAANTLAEMDGGQVVIKDSQVIGKVALPIGGLMSNEHAEKVAARAQTVLDGFKACGCRINNPNMTMSLLALVVIPELRLSDKGLVDVNTFSFIPVIQK